MVDTQGYVCEEHTVTTKDGYILSLQRIPAGRSGKKSNKPPVLLQHGILIDAAAWLLNSPDESLAFILADEGFDVWLANTRGTQYSSGHTSLSSNDPAYWDWSWDELAAYDLPAFFEYVNDQTGQDLHYVGHSLDLYWLGLHEFLPGGEAVANLVGEICNKTHSNCSDLMVALTGQACCVNSSTIDVLLQHALQPTATRNLIHLAQMIRKGTIAMYDYGNEDDNNKHYGQPTPPAYDMASIPKDLPLFMGYGGQDLLADVKDVQTLLDTLKDHDADKLVTVFREEYAHADFVFGVNANQVVYDPLMAFFKLH